jgi:hypothetical protein
LPRVIAGEDFQIHQKVFSINNGFAHPDVGLLQFTKAIIDQRDGIRRHVLLCGEGQQPVEHLLRVSLFAHPSVHLAQVSQHLWTRCEPGGFSQLCDTFFALPHTDPAHVGGPHDLPDEEGSGSVTGARGCRAPVRRTSRPARQRGGPHPRDRTGSRPVRVPRRLARHAAVVDYLNPRLAFGFELRPAAAVRPVAHPGAYAVADLVADDQRRAAHAELRQVRLQLLEGVHLPELLAGLRLPQHLRFALPRFHGLDEPPSGRAWGWRYFSVSCLSVYFWPAVHQRHVG